MYNLSLPEQKDIPNSYKLYSCYPNPFNPVTSISFDLPNSGDVIIEIYDIRGNFIKTAIRESFESGYHEFTFDASNLSSGIYIYKLTSGNFIAVSKMTLLK